MEYEITDKRSKDIDEQFKAYMNRYENRTKFKADKLDKVPLQKKSQNKETPLVSTALPQSHKGGAALTSNTLSLEQRLNELKHWGKSKLEEKRQVDKTVSPSKPKKEQRPLQQHYMNRQQNQQNAIQRMRDTSLSRTKIQSKAYQIIPPISNPIKEQPSPAMGKSYSSSDWLNRELERIHKLGNTEISPFNFKEQYNKQEGSSDLSRHEQLLSKYSLGLTQPGKQSRPEDQKQAKISDGILTNLQKIQSKIKEAVKLNKA